MNRSLTVAARKARARRAGQQAIAEILRILPLALLVALGSAAAQVTVHGTVTLMAAGKSQKEADASNAVIWLTAASGSKAPPAAGKFEMLQHRKRFEPHVLAVPAGSTVSFPNLDPFFHNVFSMFDGKRFDLGLYEAGASHSVTFDRTGVCYIFCNVHPEMSGVVVVLDTPYHGKTNPAGEYTIRDVPAGRYTLSIWHERGKPEDASTVARMVQISPENTTLAPIRLRDTGQLLAPHKNKYGKDYDAPAPGLIYRK